MPAALYGALVFPVIWGVTEQMTYNGYLASRFQVLGGSAIAIAAVAFVWSPQHAFMPLTFDDQFMLFRLLSQIPYSTFGMVLYQKLRRLLPLVIAHAVLDGASVVGAVLIAAGVTLSAWMSLHFRRSKTPISPLLPTRRLVISGPYRFSRNPDYLGQTLVYVGIGLALNSAWPLIALVPALLILRYAVIAKEERYLHRLFGAEYDDYCRRVRRWL